MSEAKSERSQGIVKFFNKQKGFGFCRRNGASDVFIHQNALKRSGIEDGVQTGDTLEFDVLPALDKGGQPDPSKGPKGDKIIILSRVATP